MEVIELISQYCVSANNWSQVECYLTWKFMWVAFTESTPASSTTSASCSYGMSVTSGRISCLWVHKRSRSIEAAGARDDCESAFGCFHQSVRFLRTVASPSQVGRTDGRKEGMKEAAVIWGPRSWRYYLLHRAILRLGLCVIRLGMYCVGGWGVSHYVIACGVARSRWNEPRSSQYSWLWGLWILAV